MFRQSSRWKAGMTRNYAWMTQCIPSRSLHHASGPRFKILFMGRDEFSCLVLNELHAATDVWEYISIATNPNEWTGRRGTHLSISPLKQFGESLNIPVHTIPHARPDFRHWKPPSPFVGPSLDHLLITASFGRILSAPLLDLFSSTRRINVHPSLLPAYRGAAPIQHTILNGDAETGVCIIEMLKRKQGIDAGSIWGCSRFPIPDGITFTSLRDALAIEGGKLLVSVLRDMKDGKATPMAQTPSDFALLARAITAADSVVNFSTMSAESIVRRHRAISHQRPLVTYLINGKAQQIHSPSVAICSGIPPSMTPGMGSYHKPTNTLFIRCANDSMLSVPSMKQEGKSLVKTKDWWNGVKSMGLLDDDDYIRFIVI